MKSKYRIPINFDSIIMKRIIPIKQLPAQLLQLEVKNGITSRIILLMIACSLMMNAQSQFDKRLVLADQYFQAGDYFTAAGLYGQFLHPAVKESEASGFPLISKKNAKGTIGNGLTRTDILFKQAESYRLANYWMEASARYKECFDIDDVKYADGLYWYAVCQRSLGNYDSAKISINQLLSTNMTSTRYVQAAKKELETLQFILNQISRPDTVMYSVKKLNLIAENEKGIFAPLTTSQNQLLFTTTLKNNVTNPEINPYRNRLFYTTLNNEDLQKIEPVIIDNMDTLLNQGAATISANGNFLYFTQWKKINGRIFSSVYYAAKKESAWSKPLLIYSVNLTGYNSKQPFCTADGKYLFFASDRPGGFGKFDIWYAPIGADGTCGEPVNAGANVNTPADELAPFYHNTTTTLVFASNGRPGMGGLDLYAAKGFGNQFSNPQNMGYPVNSSRDDIYFFAPENAPLLNNALFSTDRGNECCMETYSVSKQLKKQMVKGLIVDCRNNEPLVNAELVMEDGAGNKLNLISDNEGNYSYRLTGNPEQQQFIINREKYNEKINGFRIDHLDESHWQTDTLYNSTICLEEKLVIKPENVVSVYFGFDESLLSRKQQLVLDSIYYELLINEKATIQISGYTDGRGSEEYNKILSDKRAKACADYIINKGLDSSRITFESFGACCPVEMELINGRDNPDGRSMNRRALINMKMD